MATVPTYVNRQVGLQLSNARMTVQASPDAFGAAIGRGMQDLGRGGQQFADAMAAVQEQEDIARAKEAENKNSRALNEAMYGEGGFMTLEGRNAVDQRKAFEDQATAIVRENGKNLPPSAARHYTQAAQARLNSIYQQSLIHTAGERKRWFKEASASRIETFANDALVNFANPAQVDKFLAAGQAELRQQGQLEGWDAATLQNREREYLSGVHKNITLRIAQNDPIAADAYMKAKASQMTGAHQYELQGALETEIKAEQSKREADAILGLGRAATRADDGTPRLPQSGRTLASVGPTRVRQFLIDKAPGKGAYAIDHLDEKFAVNLAALMQDAPPRIRDGLAIMSGHRSFAHQTRLFNNSDRTGHSVAHPGRSNHEVRSDGTAKAVDLMWNGKSLKHAPKDVVDWVHANARNYGMYFPMSWEPWHIEPVGTRGGGGAKANAVQTVAPRSNNVAPRAMAPSYDEIEERLSAIADDDVRDLTRKRVYAQLAAQDKYVEAQEKAAKAELWKYVDQGATPDQVPMEIRQAAGMSAVSSAWSYIETAAKGREIESDELLLYDMRRSAAADPASFSQVDLNEYRDRLSKAAIKELTGLQTGALTDERKAREEGLNLTNAYSQAGTQLEAVGITTVGKDGSAREEAARRIAQFQNALSMEMEAFKQANADRPPTQVDIQSMINKLLLPIVVKQEKSFWDPTNLPWSSTSESKGFLFEAGTRPDGSAVDVVVEYDDIPIDMRRAIAIDLEGELGRKPSEDEIVSRYEDVALNR